MEMIAGRELDAMIAEKVMGFNLVRAEEENWFEKINQFPAYCVWDTGGALLYTDASASGKAFLPSTDIAAAFTVIEHLRKQGYGFLIGTRAGGWIVRAVIEIDMEEKIYTGNANTLPLAICLAALQAVGVAGDQKGKE